MKKFILFAAILFAGVSVVNAQEVSDNTKLTLTFDRFQAISVSGPVDLHYESLDHYNNGKEVDITGHLTVSSAGSFIVKVGANDLKNETLDKEILANTITVTAKKEGVAQTAATIGSIASPSQVIQSSQGGLNMKYDVNYKGGAQYAAMEGLFNATGQTVYETTVFYTIYPE